MRFRQPDECDHCWHVTRRPMLIIIKDGFVHQTCCKCSATRSLHADHLWDDKSRKPHLHVYPPQRLFPDLTPTQRRRAAWGEQA